MSHGAPTEGQTNRLRPNSFPRLESRSDHRALRGHSCDEFVDLQPDPSLPSTSVQQRPGDRARLVRGVDPMGDLLAAGCHLTECRGADWRVLEAQSAGFSRLRAFRFYSRRSAFAQRMSNWQ